MRKLDSVLCASCGVLCTTYPFERKEGKKGDKAYSKHIKQHICFLFLFLFYAFSCFCFFVFNALVFKRSCSRVGLSFIAEKGAALSDLVSMFRV